MPVKEWNASDFTTYEQRTRHCDRAHDHWRSATNAYHWLYGRGQVGEYLPYRKLDGVEIAKFQRTAEQDLRRFGWNTLEMKAAVEWLRERYPSGFRIEWPQREGSKSKAKGNSFAAGSNAGTWTPAPTLERDYPEAFRQSDDQRQAMLRRGMERKGVQPFAEIIFS